MERYLPHHEFPAWPAHHHSIKTQLGLPKKLGPRPAHPVLVGRLADNTGQRVEIWDLPNRGFHRLHARYGDRMIPVGRVHQTRFT